MQLNGGQFSTRNHKFSLSPSLLNRNRIRSETKKAAALVAFMPTESSNRDISLRQKHLLPRQATMEKLFEELWQKPDFRVDTRNALRFDCPTSHIASSDHLGSVSFCWRQKKRRILDAIRKNSFDSIASSPPRARDNHTISIHSFWGQTIVSVSTKPHPFLDYRCQTLHSGVAQHNFNINSCSCRLRCRKKGTKTQSKASRTGEAARL